MFVSLVQNKSADHLFSKGNRTLPNLGSSKLQKLAQKDYDEDRRKDLKLLVVKCFKV